MRAFLVLFALLGAVMASEVAEETKGNVINIQLCTS